MSRVSASTIQGTPEMSLFRAGLMPSRVSEGPSVSGKPSTSLPALVRYRRANCHVSTIATFPSHKLRLLYRRTQRVSSSYCCKPLAMQAIHRFQSICKRGLVLIAAADLLTRLVSDARSKGLLTSLLSWHRLLLLLTAAATTIAF